MAKVRYFDQIVSKIKGKSILIIFWEKIQNTNSFLNARIGEKFTQPLLHSAIYHFVNVDGASSASFLGTKVMWKYIKKKYLLH